MTQRENELGKIEFDHLGMGEVLSRGRYEVPPYQREYAWSEKEVEDLFNDLKIAMQNNSAYFLGTIVLTKGKNNIPEISDGQQRLATTTMLLAAIRDWYASNGEPNHGLSIQNKFLSEWVIKKNDYSPRLTLNIQDRDFFKCRILAPPDTPDREIQPKKRSHLKMIEAQSFLKRKIENEVGNTDNKNLKISILDDWIDFIEKKAQAIVLKVSDDLNAFVMFETLNDRGLRTSQADLVKNYLFDNAGADRIDEVQVMWASVIAQLETIESEDLVIPFLRHFLGSKYSEVTREREVFSTVKDNVKGSTPSIAFIDKLVDYSKEYVAILNPNSSKWNGYNPRIRKHVETISTVFRIEQIRPLMMSVAKHFDKKEAEQAFRLFVHWSVRFMVAGGGSKGNLEKAYTDRARDVMNGKIITARQLALAMMRDVPTDIQFKAAFEEATVSKSHLARYYLRALELKVKGSDEPELVPNEDTVITLEHILPQNPENGWNHIDSEIAKSYYKRLGNMVLLQASKNSEIGNKPFEEKREIFEKSPYYLTNMVARNSSWGIEEIKQRQKTLAENAVELWTAS